MTPAQLLLETLRLRHSLEADQLRKDWQHADTRGLARLVLHEGCALWLYRRLKELELDASEAPWRPFHAWLSRQARRTTAQNSVVAGHACEVLRFFNDAQVPCLLIHGVARLFASDTYPFADARETNGIEVFVPDTEGHAIWRAMRNAGYEIAPGTPRTPTALETLINESDVPVVLHTQLAESQTGEEEWRQTLPNAAQTACADGKLLVPSATDLLWQSITNVFRHAEYAFRIGFLQDAACILASDRKVDWDGIRSRLHLLGEDGKRSALSWLGAAAWLAGAPLSPEISGGVAPFHLSRSTLWRLAVARRLDPGTRAGHTFVRQATLAEVGRLPADSQNSGARVFGTLGNGIARATYLSWRMTGPDRRVLTAEPPRSPVAVRERKTETRSP